MPARPQVTDSGGVPIVVEVCEMGKKRERIAELEEQVSVLLAKCHAQTVRATYLEGHIKALEGKLQSAKSDASWVSEALRQSQEIEQAGVWR